MSVDHETVRHLDSGEVAAYLDRALPAADRAQVEDHLAACAACRGEVVAVARLLRARPDQRRWYLPAGVAAAAAVLLLVVPWQRLREPTETPALREPAVTTTVPPVSIAPIGAVAKLPALTWSSVPHADRYHVTVLDGKGAIIWETETADTAAAVSPTVALVAGVPYYWKIAARTGWGRWVSSDLTTFTLRAASPPR